MLLLMVPRIDDDGDDAHDDDDDADGHRYDACKGSGTYSGDEDGDDEYEYRDDDNTDGDYIDSF